MFRSYKNWLLTEKQDIFGFEGPQPGEQPGKGIDHEAPVNQVDIEFISDYLGQHAVGSKRPFVKFINEVVWGDQTGSLRVTISPDLSVIFDRKVRDMEGNPVWVTKKVFQINQQGYGGHEESLASEILEELQMINDVSNDSAKKEFDGIRNVVDGIAEHIRATAKRDVFIFQGIRQFGENTFCIAMSVRGGGGEEEGQGRVMENQTWISFDNKTGLIRVSNYNIGSAVTKSEWKVKPMDLDMHFAPTQSVKEIASTIGNFLHWY
jgi:hypothetical protein